MIMFSHLSKGRLSQLETSYADYGSLPYYQHITDTQAVAFPLAHVMTVSSHGSLDFHISKKKVSLVSKTLVWVIGSVIAQ